MLQFIIRLLAGRVISHLKLKNINYVVRGWAS